MSENHNNKASRGRHAALADLPSIDANTTPAGGFVPEQPHAYGSGQRYGAGSQFPNPGMLDTGKPKKKLGKVLGITLGCVVVVLAIAYCGVAFYFSSHFMPNSTIGNLDTSLMSSSEVQRSLTQEVNAYKLTVTGDGFNLTVSAKDAGIAFDAEEVVDSALAQTNHWLWPLEITRTHDATDAMVSSYNSSGLEQVVTQTVSAFNATATQPVNASVAYDAKTGTFTISKESVGTAIDPAKVIVAADKALADLNPTVTLTSDDLLQPTVLSTDTRLQSAAEKANTMITADIVLTMDDTKVAEVNADLISEWVTLGDDVEVELDNDAMTAWVDKLASDCNTVGSTRTYTRADGKVITVSGGVYGWSIDYDALLELVSNGVKDGVVETVAVPYTSYGDAYNGVGGRDWGNRYIDIDLAEQHVRFYDDSGSLVWESDCISGIPDGTHDTSVGVYWMNAMQSPGKLTGYENGEKIYESTVQYWMPFDGNAIGLHDADWQPDFGGTMYKDGYGSHGCVNLPPEKAKELYALVHSGDCVVSHW